MPDMSSVIVAKSDQINGPDLIDAPRTVEIVSVRLTGKEQATEIKIAGDVKVWRPNKNTVRLMARAWGNDSDKWIGNKATLYYDPKVKYGKDEPGGVRISHLSGLREKMVMCLQERKGVLRTYEIEPLRAAKSAPVAAPDPEPRDWAAYALDFQARVASAPDKASLAELREETADDRKTMRAMEPALNEACNAAYKARANELSSGEVA